MEERTIKRITGVHLVRGGEEPEGWLPPEAARPPRTPVHEATCTVEIVFDGYGWLVVCDSDDPAFCSDTWHESLEAAERQAQIDFDIEPSQWEDAS